VTTRVIVRPARSSDASGEDARAPTQEAKLRPRSLLGSALEVSPAVWLGAAAGLLLIAVVMALSAPQPPPPGPAAIPSRLAPDAPEAKPPEAKPPDARPPEARPPQAEVPAEAPTAPQSVLPPPAGALPDGQGADNPQASSVAPHDTPPVARSPPSPRPDSQDLKRKRTPRGTAN
jgi:hypothetical protein